MEKRNIVLSYIIEEYFDGSAQNASEASGYSIKKINNWLSGNIQPNRNTIEYFIHFLFTPQFKVIVEFGEFNPENAVRAQINTLLTGHEKKTGIYAFYDSMGHLLYVGKAATCLLDEMYQTIKRRVDIDFPAGIKNKPEFQYHLVRYISAYDVGGSNWIDYPKHVESLILRISKPPLNKYIGFLEKAYDDQPES